MRCTTSSIRSLSAGCVRPIEDSGIKVDWDPCGKYLCCSETKSFKLIETESEELDQMKVHYEIYEGEETRQAHRHPVL